MAKTETPGRVSTTYLRDGKLLIILSHFSVFPVSLLTTVLCGIIKLKRVIAAKAKDTVYKTVVRYAVMCGLIERDEDAGIDQDGQD